jgi:hypothetical protein
LTSKAVGKGLTDNRAKDLAKMIKRATSQPGVAEVLTLHSKYREKLAEIERQLGKRHLATITTSDSTA